MQQKAILYGIIGLLSGILLTIFFTTNIVNSNNTGMMQMMGINTNRSQMMNQDENIGKKGHMMQDGSMMMDEDEMGMSMDDMVASLKGKTGDAFDKIFLSEMIEHHQGAIDMANLAKQYAGHEEIKTMAEDIITTQTQEIEQMKTWQKEWVY